MLAPNSPARIFSIPTHSAAPSRFSAAPLGPSAAEASAFAPALAPALAPQLPPQGMQGEERHHAQPPGRHAPATDGESGESDARDESGDKGASGPMARVVSWAAPLEQLGALAVAWLAMSALPTPLHSPSASESRAQSPSPRLSSPPQGPRPGVTSLAPEASWTSSCLRRLRSTRSVVCISTRKALMAVRMAIQRNWSAKKYEWRLTCGTVTRARG
mmetsp:Transcript_25682/g.57594  ORF Transcript_25682/g.57594 Transcript_25682/m.57594 type:complete len:216 (+) Transcript_25682:499-1146(+)